MEPSNTTPSATFNTSTKSKIVVKLALFLSILAIIAIVSTGYINMNKTRGLILKNLQSQLMVAANTIALSIDGDAYAQLTGKASMQTPQYKAIRTNLEKFHTANKHLGFDSDCMYTFRRISEDSLEFTVMLHDQYVGNRYKIREQMLPVLENGKTNYTDIYVDENGTWVSAYAPILNSAEQVVGLVEVDFKDNVYLLAVNDEIYAIAMFSLLGIGVAVLAAFLVSAYIARPVEKVSRAAVQLSTGDYTVSVPETSRDEIGMLARAFNFMVKEIREKKEALEEALGQLKEAQKQMVGQEKLASLGTLTAGIAHEMKNPLNFVSNFGKLSYKMVGQLKSTYDDAKDQLPETAQGDFEFAISTLELNIRKIQEHSQRADDIIHSMMQHSRGTSAEYHPVDLNELIQEYSLLSYKGFRAKDPMVQIHMTTEYDDTIGMVHLVSQDLSRVIINIVSNACYELVKKKNLLGDEFKPEIRINTLNHEEHVEVRIRDNGNGIPEEIRKDIFTPFFTTKPTGEGTGLGLSMSYDIIVQAHKGIMHVDSKDGEFTEFVIILPKNIEGMLKNESTGS